MGDIIDFSTLTWDRRKTKDIGRKSKRENNFILAAKEIEKTQGILNEEKRNATGMVFGLVGMMFNAGTKDMIKEKSKEVEAIIDKYFRKKDIEELKICFDKIGEWITTNVEK